MQALGSDIKTVRGCLATNTGENSTKVHCVSITLLLAFEWNRKSLKLVKVRVKFPTLATHKDGAPGCADTGG